LRAARLSFLVLIASATFSCMAQETVTIQKSRLEELERKEAELEKVKGELKTTRGENVQLKKQHAEDRIKLSASPPVQPAISRISPPISSLPALAQGDVVDSMDLSTYYRTDPAAADARFRKRTFKVEGEIIAFEKPLFIRDYRILLKSSDRDIRIVCNFSPPERYSAVLTIKNGSELVGQISNQNRVPIAKVGDRVFIEGECRGLRDGAIKLVNCELELER